MKQTPNGVRFAPSPTGRFHVGNLRTAWIASRWARSLGQPLIFRFEDIDTPRVVQGAQQQQLADMAALGVVPDAVVVQSERRARHWELFQRARAEGAIYPCFCSRKEVLAGLASAPHAVGALYGGACRALGSSLPAKVSHPSIAWRLKAANENGFDDFIVARTGSDASPESFVPSYNWACAIDDFDGGYSLLVRAWDLDHVAGQQRAVQQWISREWTPPAIFHCSLVVQNDGHRLEKRTRGVTLEEIGAAEMLARFEAGFRLPEFQPGQDFGEDRRTLSLGELGF